MRYQFMRFPGGRAKAVTLSYDDASPYDIPMTKVLNAHGMKCTYNMISEIKTAENTIPKDFVDKMILGKGHEIAVHGALHLAEGSIRPIEGIQDVLNCRLELEKKYGIIIRGMAYPDCGITTFHNGTTYERIKQYLTDLDIVYARTLGQDNNKFLLPTDWHRWMPTAHHANPSLMTYIDAFLALDTSEKVYGSHRYPRLFYLWGHSSEFERAGNWDLLDRICEKLGGHQEIWYATNMEIYEYVQAYESLEYSADGKIVYNPTLLTVWFDVDGKLFSIAPGQTLFR